jgi:hypothetical protein
MLWPCHKDHRKRIVFHQSLKPTPRTSARQSRRKGLPATLDELETQLMQAVGSLDAGRGVNGETVFRRLRKRIKKTRG